MTLRQEYYTKNAKLYLNTNDPTDPALEHYANRRRYCLFPLMIAFLGRIYRLENPK